MVESTSGRRERFKQGLPWPTKFLVKLAFGAMRIDYRVLKKLGLVEHGRMEDANFARSVLEEHVLAVCREYDREPTGALLELGPGDSVATGVLGRNAGFSAVHLVDAGPFADLQSSGLDRLFSSLGATPPGCPPDASPPQVTQRLNELGIHYRTDGVKSLRCIEAASISHSFSNTVLQHVARSEVSEIIGQLGRVQESGGITSHCINYTDHFSGGFVNHKLPTRFMESSLIKRAHLYTNRLGPTDYLELFERAGFRALKLEVYFHDDSVSQTPKRYDSRAALRADTAGRTVSRTNYVLRKT